MGRISITHIILIYELITKVSEIKATQNSTKLPWMQKEKKNLYKLEKDWKMYTKMKNFHKNKNKRGDDPTPIPKSHNVLIGSWESSPTTQHTKQRRQNYTRTLNWHIYTQANTLSHKHNHTQSTTRSHIYTKLTPPKTCINQPINTTNHNT